MLLQSHPELPEKNLINVPYNLTCPEPYPISERQKQADDTNLMNIHVL